MRPVLEVYMSGIQDFIGMATQKLAVSHDTVEDGTSGLLTWIRKQVGEADFGKLAAAIPGAADLAKAKVGAGAGGVLGELAAKAGGLFGKGGGATGAIAALAHAGLNGEKATSFVRMFADFVKGSVPPDLLKTISSKIPGLPGLIG